MTVRVAVSDKGIIVEAAPVVQKFIGQALDNLKNWMGKYGGLRVEKL